MASSHPPVFRFINSIRLDRQQGRTSSPTNPAQTDPRSREINLLKQAQTSKDTTKSVIAKRFRRTRVLLSLWFVFIGWVWWEMSPFNGRTMIVYTFLGVFWVPLLERFRVPRAGSLYLLTIVELLCIATLHDLTVTTSASARCCDGAYSYSAHPQGSCSWHSGVCEWGPEVPPWWRTILR